MLEDVRLLTGRLYRSASHFGSFFVKGHHQDKSDDDAGGSHKNRNSETIHFFHGRDYTDYGVTAGISLMS